MISFKSLFKRFWWILLILTLLTTLLVVFLVSNKGKKITEEIKNGWNPVYDSDLPQCPSDLSGLLTVSMIDIEYLASLTPLGNSNPPGHTFPVDHVYF